ncbi:MAG: hypothetical protein J6P58_06745 [Oscillospiraceae bacterium]|nr:hypothetical protein [Oscillospiraceae bacterium]
MQPRIKRILFTLLIIALGVFFYGVFGRNTLLLSLDNDAVTLSGPESSAYSVPFSSIASMELREDFDPGKPADGGTKNHIRYGLWHNAEFGDYQLFASDRIDTVIVLWTAGGEVLVYNYESVKTTLSYFESFAAFLTEQGYAIETK